VTGRVFITPHAVARYCERVYPAASYEQALGALIDYMASARLVKIQNNGVALYRTTRFRDHLGRVTRLRLIVANPDWLTPQLVTVETEHDHPLGTRRRRRAKRERQANAAR